MNNQSIDYKSYNCGPLDPRPSTGSIDCTHEEVSGFVHGDEDQDRSVSVKYIQNQQIVEADNCCF